MRMSVKDDWELWGFNVVQFGDKPAAALLSVAVEKASETWEKVAEDLKVLPEKVKEDSVKLREDSYVDDGTTGGSIEDVNRMQGIKGPNGEFSGTIPSMYRAVGLKLKTMVRSFSTDIEESEKLSGKVLGYGWNPKNDLMSVAIKFNFSKKRKGLRTQPDMTIADIESFKVQTHNRRTLLSICNSIYDPLGVISPVTIKLKLLMRDSLSVNEPTDWDSPVSSHLIDDWASTIEDALTAEQVYFSRCTHPMNPVKLPRLVTFFDGSEQAYAAASYIVWLVYKDK